jgi:hypothetical protein
VNSTEKASIWRMLLSAKACTAEVGTSPTRKSSKPSDLAGAVAEEEACGDDGSMWMPEPGLST